VKRAVVLTFVLLAFASAACASLHSRSVSLCPASSLAEAREDGSAASGVYVRVWLRNTSRQSCRLSGAPRYLHATSDEGRQLPAYGHGSGTMSPPIPGSLNPGKVGLVIFVMSGACDGPQTPIYRNVSVGMPGGGSLSVPQLELSGSCAPSVSTFGVKDSGGATFEGPVEH
jgi:uncharacterized protein DUF4232